jgi:hypothetical protein
VKVNLLRIAHAHLLSQKLGRVSDTPNHTEAASIGDSSGKLRTGCDVHPCKKCEPSCSRCGELLTHLREGWGV